MRGNQQKQRSGNRRKNRQRQQVKGRYIFLRTITPLFLLWLLLIIIFTSFNESMFMGLFSIGVENRLETCADDIEQFTEQNNSEASQGILHSIPWVFYRYRGLPGVACILYDEEGKEVAHNNLKAVIINADGEANIYGYVDYEKIKKKDLEKLSLLIDKEDITNIQIYLDAFYIKEMELFPKKAIVYEGESKLGTIEFEQKSIKGAAYKKDSGKTYGFSDFDCGEVLERSEKIAELRTIIKKSSPSISSKVGPTTKKNKVMGIKSGNIGEYRYICYQDMDMSEQLQRISMSIAFLTFLIFMGVGSVIALGFRKLYRSQQALERCRKKTTDALAHDLKTPLAVISGYAENLKENIQNGKREHYADSILQEAAHMNDIICKMLELSKLEHKSELLQLTGVDLRALSEDVAARLKEQLERKGIAVEHTGSGRIMADADMMKRLMENLISNAAAYGNAGVPIVILISNESYVITNHCRDAGKLNIEELWNPYVKADKARENHMSTGIGLSIVQQIIELHGFEKIGRQEADKVIFGFRIN